MTGARHDASMAIELQTVEVLLSDGRIGVFTGPVLVRRDGEAMVRAIRFFPPVSVPSDAVKFESVGELLAECGCSGTAVKP